MKERLTMGAVARDEPCCSDAWALAGQIEDSFVKPLPVWSDFTESAAICPSALRRRSDNGLIYRISIN